MVTDVAPTRKPAKVSAGHGSAQLCVFGRIDHAHSTGAKFLQDAVVRYGLAYHWRKSYV